MDSSFDRAPREMASLELDGVCVYRDSILSGLTLGPFWNRFSLDGFVFPPDVPRLLVRGQADRAWNWACAFGHLEIFRGIVCGWLHDPSDHQSYAAFCHDSRGP